MTYTTFKRSARNFEEFSSAEKITVETGLTYEDAYDICQDFNSNRSDDELAAGTKLEFEREE